jgi:tRNA 2-selenouridine synthase
MIAAPRVAIAAPRPARADYLVRAYADMVQDAARLASVLDQLRMSQPKDLVEGWHRMASDGRFAELADGLMAAHYDPRYDKHRERMAVPCAEISAPALGAADLPALAEAVADEVLRLTSR